MTTALRCRRRALALTLALVAGAGTLVVANPVQAQVIDPGTGAYGVKNCPGDDGAHRQHHQLHLCRGEHRRPSGRGHGPFLDEPIPEWGPRHFNCTAVGGATITVGSTLESNVLCAGAFTFTIPNDPALCETA